jgi:hypothetical protein
LNAIDHRDRIEQIGFAGARATAAHVARCDRAPVDANDCRTGPPSSTGSLVMTDQHARHVGDVAEAHRR